MVLDVYILTVAFLSTMRNWTNLTVIEVSRFLLSYRLLLITLPDRFRPSYRVRISAAAQPVRS